MHSAVQFELAAKGSKLRDRFQKLRELLTEADEGTYITGAQTVAAFLDLWLDRIKARVMESGADRDRSPNTWRRYESLVRLNIKPVLGRIVLTKLTPPDIERAIDTWREMPVRNCKSGKKLSGRTVFNIFETLNSALTKAVSWKQLKANPCAHVEAPRQRELTNLAARTGKPGVAPGPPTDPRAIRASPVPRVGGSQA